MFDISSLDLIHNQVFMGIVSASGLGALTFVCRQIPHNIWEFIERRTSVTLRAYERSNVFPWLDQWLMQHPTTGNMRKLRADVVGEGQTLSSANIPDSDGDAGRKQMKMLPGFGRHLIWHKRRPIIVHRFMEDAKDRPREVLDIKALFVSRRWFNDMIREVESANLRSEETVRVITPNEQYWNYPVRIPKRALETVFIDGGRADSMLKDAAEFLEAKPKYRKVGAPWRRGYLFKGAPGTGKTTLAIAIASALDLPIYSVSLAKPMTDMKLVSLVKDMASQSILLIEDADSFDSAQSRETKKDDDDEGAVTLSGLLNALDGVTAGDGRLLIITSNHPEKLDAALVRPGRVDMHVEFGTIGDAELRRMLELYFDEAWDGRHPFAPVNPSKAQAIMQQARNISEAVVWLDAEGRHGIG